MSTEKSDDVIWLRGAAGRSGGVGRPASYTLAEIAATAITVADRDGLDAVSMRRVAAELGTGASSLYRYVATRDELLDVMIDQTAADNSFSPPTGDPVHDLVRLAHGQRDVLRAHMWLPALIAGRAPLGPNGADLLERFLTIVEDVPISPAAQLEAFAVFNSLIASYVQNEVRDGTSSQSRSTQVYLAHLASAGDHPAIGRLLASLEAAPDDGFAQLIERVLVGLLGLGRRISHRSHP